MVIDEEEVQGNSTRWIFDVEHKEVPNTGAAVHPILDRPVVVTYDIRLLDFRHKKPRPNAMLSPHVTPLNEAACASRIFFPDPDLLRICVHLRGGPLYRVTVDALHSLNR